MSRNGVNIQLDKPRTIRFDFNSLCLIEDILKRNMTQVVVEINSKILSTNTIRALLWGGLIHEDENLSLGDVGNLIDEAEDFGEIMKALGQAIDSSCLVPKPKDDDGDEKNVETLPGGSEK